MNNKGQTLVTFILFLPIIFLMMAIIYDLGSLELEKHKTENEIKNTINYGFDNLKEENLSQKLQTLLDKNIDGTKTVIIDNVSIKIHVNYIKESIFPNIIKKNYNINVTYKGYINNKTIKKE